MDEQLRWLVELQEKASHILRIEEKIQTFPQVIASLRAKLQSFQEEFSKSSEALEGLETGRRSGEGDLKAAEEKVRKLKGKTQEVKTNKEYQALLKEIEQAEEEKSGIEEKILQLLEEADVLRKTVVMKKEGVQAEESVFRKEKERLESEGSEMGKAVAVLRQEKETFLPHLETRILAEYQRLLLSRKGSAVV
ncbi:MAG: hypothetical protein HY760_09010, partial [Nitrospirae bacterium]|nr:hypothetical protein [Nitrospirota bacterium]